MKILILITTLMLSACGYSPIYESTAQYVSQVAIEKVVVAQDKKLPGERRVAQLVNRRLSQVFTGGLEGGAYRLNLYLDEDRRTLAILRDATEDRFEVRVTARIELLDIDGKMIYTKDLTSSAPYNVESSPYSTDAGKDRARKSAAESLSAEVIQNINFFLHEQKK